MVRTKGDGGASRTVASKAPRKALGGGGSSSAAARAISAAAGGQTPGSPGGKYQGGNSYNPQPTPNWQKPLTSFFVPDPSRRPPKMQDDQDEQSEEPSNETSSHDRGKGDKPTKNGIISDSDED